MRRKHNDPSSSSAVEVLRSRTRELIYDIDSAMKRFADPADAEALHDVRVSLRRLRVWLRAFESPLHIKPSWRRRLKRFARSTTLARDAEVALQWSAKLEPANTGRTAAGGFSHGLHLIRDKNYRLLRQELAAAWQPLATKLQRQISHTPMREARGSFQEVLVGALRRYARKLDAALADTGRRPDSIHIHSLRIASKRVRYLIEIAGLRHSGAPRLVRELKALHNLAGRIHDLQRYMELSEDVFRRQASLRYRRLLQGYMNTGIDDRRLPLPRSDAFMLPLLQSCRRAARYQTREIAMFEKRYLGRNRPTFILHLRRLIAHLDESVTGK